MGRGERGSFLKADLNMRNGLSGDAKVKIEQFVVIIICVSICVAAFGRDDDDDYLSVQASRVQRQLTSSLQR